MSEVNEIVIQDDIEGRLKNTPLPFNNALLPLFESIINSIQSIEDGSTRNSGKIVIHIVRERQRDGLKESGEDNSFAPIDGYVIKDNGVGFNDENFTSFTTADSRLKEHKGGKGVGRFIWLKAFDTVKIDSVFRNNEDFYQRSFTFKKSTPVIDNGLAHKVGTIEPYSEVQLCGIKSGYQRKTPSSPNKIAQKIIDHCVLYILSPTCPEIILIDQEKEDFINVNEMFRKEVSQGKVSLEFFLGNHLFEIDLLFLNSNYEGEHRISLCADEREVKGFNMKKFIPDISGRKVDSKNAVGCTLLALVRSKYLDEIVNSERTDFLFSSSDEDDVFDFTEKQVLELTASKIKEEFETFLEGIKHKKLARIAEFVENEEPEYRVLMKHASTEISDIPDGLDDNKLDSELHSILHKIERQVKEEGREFINDGTEDALKTQNIKKDMTIT